MTAQAVFLRLLDESVADARIGFVVDGAERVVGRAGAGPDGGAVTVRVHRPRFFARVLGYGNLGLGEAFMDGDFEMERGTLHAFLTILLRNRLEEKVRGDVRLAVAALAIRLQNALRKSHGNVRRHYDLGEDLFESFLDATLTYSCGFAESPDDGLERLQENKRDRICRKLRLRPGDTLLDIGCGFGGLLIHAAERYGAEATGVTNSRCHWERGRAEVAKRGLGGRVRIELADFRAVRGRYSKVVSVGMMEHVPRGAYGPFFRTIADALERGGLGLLHTIGCAGSRNDHDPFIQRYVFPASNQPRLSEIARHLERRRLAVLDVENIKPHYGHTVLRWLERFQAARDGLDPARYDARFKRMWEYYLCCGVAAASASNAAVFQVLFTNDHAAAIPLRRV